MYFCKMNFECDMMSNNDTMDFTTQSQQAASINKLNINNFQHQQQLQQQQLLHSESSISPFNTSSILSNDDYNTNTNTFDRLICQTKSNTILTSNSSTNSLNDKDTNDSDESIDCDSGTNTAATTNYVLSQQQQKCYQQSFLPSLNSLNRNCLVPSDANILQQKALNIPTSASCLSNYLIDRNVNYNEDFLNSVNKFQCVLMAPTSPAVKINEDTLTYLNQGQSYELKLNRADANSNNKSQQLGIKKCKTDNDSDFYKYEQNLDKNSKDDEIYLSIIRLCFWDRKLQEIEHEEIREWEKEYHDLRMLEVDNNLSLGAFDIRVSHMYTNAIEVIWNGKYGSSIFLKFNCTSTAFAKNKHGGEKGVHMRLQIDTFEIVNPSVIPSLKTKHKEQQQQTTDTSIVSANNTTQVSNITTKLEMKPIFPENNDWWKHLCSSYCRIQLFRLKGAQRKLKTDRSKIERLNPPDLKRRYQTSEAITMLYNCAFDSLYSLLPLDRNELNQRNLQFQKQTTLQNDLFDPLHANFMQTNDYLKPAISASTAVTTAPVPATTDNNTIPHFYCENEFNNSTIQNGGSLNESIQYYLENNTFFNESKFGLIKELMVEDITAIIDETSDSENILSNACNTLSPNRRNSLTILSAKTKLESDIITTNPSSNLTPFASLIPQTTITAANNRPLLASSSSLPHDLSQLGAVKNNLLTHQPVPTVPNNSTPTTDLTTTTTKQLYAAQVSLCTENRALIPNTAAIKNTTMTTATTSPRKTTLQTTQAALIQKNIPLANDASSKYVQQWLVANRFNNLLPVFKNYTSNDFLRLSKDDLIKLCGAPDAIRCYNLAHNIQISPKLTIFVKFNQKNYFYAIYFNDCKCKYLIRNLLQFYRTEFQQQNLTNVNNNIISTQNNDSLNENSQCNNTDIDNNYELFLKAKGILVKMTDDVLNNIHDEAKFLVEFVKKEKNLETTNYQNKELMLFDNDCDLKFKQINDQSLMTITNSIILIPLD